MRLPETIAQSYRGLVSTGEVPVAHNNIRVLQEWIDMVGIDFIKTTSCPVCGCSTIVSESVEIDHDTHQIRRHAHGGNWEYREFACGYEVHYCPNFHKEEVLKKCAFDREEAERKQKRERVRQLIVQQIESGECDDAYKNRLIQAIQYI